MLNKSNKEKVSPLKQETLRQAGQSSKDKIDQDIYEQVIFPIIFIVFLLYVTIIEWLRSFFTMPNTPLIFTFITLIFGIYFAFKIRKSIKKIRKKQMGYDGELIVAESLDELRVFGYKVYNDIVSDKFNIDHVIVGPAGVFTVETKTYSKPKGVNAQIHYSNNEIMIDGIKKLEKDPVEQAINQRSWLIDFLKRSAKVKTDVLSIVVFPGWYIDSKHNSEVLVVNEKGLISKIKQMPITLNQETINLISSHLEVYSRNN